MSPKQVQIQVSKLLKRNNQTGIVLTDPIVPVDCGVLIKNPYPKTAVGLVQFMTKLHQKKGWVPAGNVFANRKLCEKLLKQISPEEVEKRMLWAARTAKHPWSIKYLERSNDENTGTIFTR